jgi:hypothetical protein
MMVFVAGSAAAAQAVVYEGYTPRSESSKTAPIPERVAASASDRQAVAYEGYTPKSAVSGVAARVIPDTSTGGV